MMFVITIEHAGFRLHPRARQLICIYNNNVKTNKLTLGALSIHPPGRRRSEVDNVIPYEGSFIRGYLTRRLRDITSRSQTWAAGDPGSLL